MSKQELNLEEMKKQIALDEKRKITLLDKVHELRILLYNRHLTRIQEKKVLTLSKQIQNESSILFEDVDE